MRVTKAQKLIEDRRSLLHNLEACEQEAHRLGLTVTGHALNNAKNACGWEMAGDVIMAGKASRGERAGEPS